MPQHMGQAGRSRQTNPYEIFQADADITSCKALIRALSEGFGLRRSAWFCSLST